MHRAHPQREISPRAYAISFEVMRRRRLTHAFTFHRDFEVAGFELLR